MYHSITIGGKNTWDDWHLVPASRPVFAQPKPKEYYTDLPLYNGAIDSSGQIGMVFNNREGSLEFIVINEWYETTKDSSGRDVQRLVRGKWASRCEEIANFLHGRVLEAVLEDDPDYIYKGRFYVNQWKSDPYYSKITIDYKLQPYKLYMWNSIDYNWLWDPFDFEYGMIPETGLWSNIRSDGTNKIVRTFTKDNYFGNMPVVPTIYTSSTYGDTKGIDLKFINTELKINKTLHLPKGTTLVDPDIIISNYTGDNTITIEMSGYGECSISFHAGKL